MVEDVEECGKDRHRATDAQQRGDQPQMTDRGEGQDALEIGLEQRKPSSIQEGGHAGQRDQPAPHGAVADRRMQSRQQKDAGLDHGGRVQIGRHRGRGGHGMG